MRELNKEKIYDLSDLTSEEYEKLFNWLLKNDSGWRTVHFESWKNNNVGFNLKHNGSNWSMQEVKPTHNAKELFYTLENVAVAVNDLTKEQKKNLESVFVRHKYFRKPYTENKKLISYNGNYKYEITYEKFMELFGSTTTDNIQPHYDNTNGSIYKFCNDQKLNSWEFDIIKRVVRCRKKGLFREDLQKTKDLIDLYLKEFTDEK